jgi:hypothetical protein
LKREFIGELPNYVKKAEVFCGGCLILEVESYASDNEGIYDNKLAKRIAECGKFDDFEIVVLHDSIEFAKSTDKFLWATWTRFNPSTDIFAKEIKIVNNHITYKAPIVIDARMKPWYPKEVEVREDIKKLVDKRWKEYFPNK